MNKNDLINNGYRYIAKKNADPHIEVWAKFTGKGDEVEYCYYIPDMDAIDDETVQAVSFFEDIMMFTFMREKLTSDFARLGIEHRRENVWNPLEDDELFAKILGNNE